MKSKLIQGGCHNDERGSIKYNNEFNTSDIKRIYTIENRDTNFIRAWQGHKIERRWFSVIQGSFEIKLIKIDNWEQPNKNLKVSIFVLEASTLDVLCLPKGYVSSIVAKEKNSKLLAMSDYSLGEIDDEYRFAPDYFEI
jgi:dTDP-4-dehydrorhamnose 3,5-epimerase-like enzyme